MGLGVIDADGGRWDELSGCTECYSSADHTGVSTLHRRSVWAVSVHLHVSMAVSTKPMRHAAMLEGAGTFYHVLHTSHTAACGLAR